MDTIEFKDLDGDRIRFARYLNGLVSVHIVQRKPDDAPVVLLTKEDMAELAGWVQEKLIMDGGAPDSQGVDSAQQLRQQVISVLLKELNGHAFDSDFAEFAKAIADYIIGGL